MKAARLFALGVLLAGLAGSNLLGAKPRVAGPDLKPSPVGEAIYLKGVLGSGETLTATRPDTEPMTGEQAACVNCHRRSGLGSKEARSIIPPITGQFLFHPRADSSEELPYIPGARLDREAYTDAKSPFIDRVLRLAREGKTQ